MIPWLKHMKKNDTTTTSATTATSMTDIINSSLLGREINSFSHWSELTQGTFILSIPYELFCIFLYQTILIFLYFSCSKNSYSKDENTEREHFVNSILQHIESYHSQPNSNDGDGMMVDDFGFVINSSNSSSSNSMKNIHLDAPYRFGSTVAGVDTFQSDVDMLYCIHCKYHIYFFNILLCGYIYMYKCRIC